jgi:hypothetical protein
VKIPFRRLFSRLAHRWNLHLTWVDPLVATACGAVVAWAVVGRDQSWSAEFVEDRASDFFLASATVAGPLLGLLVAALAVLADHLRQGDVGAKLASNHRATLVRVFVRTTFWLGLSTAAALLGLLISGTCARQWTLAALLVLLVVSAAMLARSISLLRAVVSAAINVNTRR